jgi:hypothetical protein
MGHHMTNVIQFPCGGRGAPKAQPAPVPGNEQQVFSPDQIEQLTFEDGSLYGWASREGRLPAHYWRLEADLKDLVVHHGVVMAAHHLALPVLFVRGWAAELGVVGAGRTWPGSDRLSAAQDPTASVAVSPLADDAFLWSGTPACA